jgi:hypothetical protein
MTSTAGRQDNPTETQRTSDEGSLENAANHVSPELHSNGDGAALQCCDAATCDATTLQLTMLWCYNLRRYNTAACSATVLQRCHGCGVVARGAATLQCYSAAVLQFVLLQRCGAATLRRCGATALQRRKLLKRC